MIIIVTDQKGLKQIFDTAKYRVQLGEKALSFHGEYPAAFPLSKEQSEKIGSKLNMAIAAKNNLSINLKI